MGEEDGSTAAAAGARPRAPPTPAAAAAPSSPSPPPPIPSSAREERRYLHSLPMLERKREKARGPLLCLFLPFLVLPFRRREVAAAEKEKK